MNSENKTWVIIVGFVTLIIITATALISIEAIDKNRLAIENGLQQCQKMGQSGTLWQRDCDR